MRTLSLALLMFAGAACAAPPDAAELLQRNFVATKVQVLTSQSTMQLVNSRGETRERKLAGWARLQANGIDADVVIRFDTPADVRGTMFLQLQHADRDDDMWIYLPALHKTRRLVSANKRDSFVGTDFSYADILPPAPSNFTATLLGEATLDGVDCWKLAAEARDADYARDVGYRRRVLWIRKDDAIEARVDYLDDGGRVLKTQTTSGHERVDAARNRWVVREREMVDHDSGHRTRIVMDRYDAKTPIPDRVFSADALGAP